MTTNQTEYGLDPRENRLRNGLLQEKLRANIYLNQKSEIVFHSAQYLLFFPTGMKRNSNIMHVITEKAWKK